MKSCTMGRLYPLQRPRFSLYFGISLAQSLNL